MFRLLLLIVALIVYGSLFPWDFRPPPLHGSWFSILLQGWPGSLDRFALRDGAINVLLYVPLGAAAFLTFTRRLGLVPSMALGVATGVLLSTGIELVQIFDRTRTPSVFDIACNTLGAMTGVWLAAGFEPHLEKALASRRAGAHGAPGAFALLALWAGYQLYPVFPSLSRTRMLERFGRLASGGWTWVDAVCAATEWIAASSLVEAAFGRRLARSRFMLLALLVPARLLLVGRGPTLADFLGVAIAVAVRVRMQVPTAVAATLLAAALTARALSPFHLSSQFHSFRWIPFEATLSQNWTSAAPVLLRKAFDYGAAVWLLNAWGARISVAAGGTAAALAVFEVIQLRLPGRTPESTDPVLALLMAAVLAWLGRARKAVR